uniref:Uncharacterized protein n=2 Tax=Hemiselmis andersenii TaxID=464988 RepID=A0A7S1MWN8_HEMAN|mmetsp:Transcript_62033/g.149275  ORF Transcript_62033/g.149275 Transcript_62033/m.149275 type:complete len:197 (+) Transcript_62033:78-668(+)
MGDKQAQAAMQAMKLAAENPEAVQAGANAVTAAQEGTARAGGVKVVGGAALAGGAAGVALGAAVVGAPVLLGAAGAAGAAYLATTGGEQGDVARQIGQNTNNLIGQAKEADQKHQITAKATAAAKGAVEKAKDFNEEHKVVEKTTEAVKGAAAKAKEINDKYDVTGKTSKALLTGFNAVTGALAGGKDTAKIEEKR